MQRVDVSARQRLVDAAVEVIDADGYYRASSNRIARRAGLTWGVIQHHFGTRDGLLLEVVRQKAAELGTALEEATIVGDTLAERLSSLLDVVWSQYRRPEFLVAAQIVMNLTRDPETAEDTLVELARLESPTHERWQQLVDDVVPREQQPEGFASSLFHILRGVAVGDELLDSMAARDGARSSDDADRRLLVAALTALLQR